MLSSSWLLKIGTVWKRFYSLPNDKFWTLPNWRVSRWQFWIWWKWQKVVQKNTYSEYQVIVFSNNRDITKCQFLHHDYNNDNEGCSNTSGFLWKQPSLKCHSQAFLLALLIKVKTCHLSVWLHIFSITSVCIILDGRHKFSPSKALWENQGCDY